MNAPANITGNLWGGRFTGDTDALVAGLHIRALSVVAAFG